MTKLIIGLLVASVVTLMATSIAIADDDCSNFVVDDVNELFGLPPCVPKLTVTDVTFDVDFEGTVCRPKMTVNFVADDGIDIRNVGVSVVRRRPDGQFYDYDPKRLIGHARPDVGALVQGSVDVFAGTEPVFGDGTFVDYGHTYDEDNWARFVNYGLPGYRADYVDSRPLTDANLMFRFYLRDERHVGMKNSQLNGSGHYYHRQFIDFPPSVLSMQAEIKVCAQRIIHHRERTAEQLDAETIRQSAIAALRHWTAELAIVEQFNVDMKATWNDVLSKREAALQLEMQTTQTALAGLAERRLIIDRWLQRQNDIMAQYSPVFANFEASIRAATNRINVNKQQLQTALDEIRLLRQQSEQAEIDLLEQIEQLEQSIE